MRRLTIALVKVVLVLSPISICACGGGGGGGGAAGTGVIEGIVQDATTQTAIQGAAVSVVGSSLHATSDSQGHYSIAHVPEGQQTVKAEATDHLPRFGTADVSANSTATLDFSVPSQAVGGSVYYVSTAGDDSHSGTQAEPWRTPAYGSRQLQPGDTLVILGGTYTMSEYDTDLVKPPFPGADNAWITVKGEDGNRPRLTGSHSLLAAVEIPGMSYIRLQNLEIASEIDNPYSGGLRGGIEAGGSAGPGGEISHVEIKDIEVHGIEEAGINFSGNIDDVTMENVYVHHTGGPAISAPGANGGSGWQNVVLRNCHVAYAGHFYQGQEQISPWERPDGIGMESSEGPLEIDHCVFEHNAGDGLDSKTKNTYVRETVIANNSCDSLKFWGDGSKAENVLIYGDGDGNPNNGLWASITIDTEHPGQFQFINVTVDDRVERGNYPVYIQYSYSAAVTILMRNCIFAHGNNVFYMGDSVTLNADHNIFYRSAEPSAPVVHYKGQDVLQSGIASLSQGDNICAEPNFVARAWGTDGDYHLRPGSPGIDAGTATGAPATDMDGTPRPQGAAVDMGSYER